jgi:hypothetical protein
MERSCHHVQGGKMVHPAHALEVGLHSCACAKWIRMRNPVRDTEISYELVPLQAAWKQAYKQLRRASMLTPLPVMTASLHSGLFHRITKVSQIACPAHFFS